MSSKIDIKPKLIKRDREEHVIDIKGKIHQDGKFYTLSFSIFGINIGKLVSLADELYF